MTTPLPLLERLGYEFDDENLARAALTHRSAGSRHNERLEFLGDALLDLAISEALLQRVPDASEGDLSRLRASLVRRDALAEIAATLDLGRFLRLGAGEVRTGGSQRRSILADTLEAVLGAVFIDGGYEPARRCVLRLYAQRLENLPDAQTLRDPKTRLQELLQARGLEPPVYEVTSVAGAAHAQRFEVLCTVAPLAIRCAGEGTSRRRAEQKAAAGVLELISAQGAGP